MDFTIAFPCRNRINLANQAIQCMLDNSSYPIIVIDDCSDNPDDDYVSNFRVNVIYNRTKKNLVRLFNQCIRESGTEYVILACDKIRPQRKDFDLIEDKLKQGFACVFLCLLHFFGFSRHLTTKIGFFDEGFQGTGYEDTDWLNRLFVDNLAIYFSKETDCWFEQGSGWPSSGIEINRRYYLGKWIEGSREIVKLHPEFNCDDMNMFYGRYNDRKYLSWEKSELYPPLKNYYKGKAGRINYG